MVMSGIDAIGAYKKAGGLPKVEGLDASADGASFGDMLKDIAKDTVDSLKGAEKATAAGATGKASLTDVVMAVSQAEMALQTVISIRDKVLGAYQEITRMGV